MIWAITDLAFLAAMLIVVLVVYAVSGKAVPIAERLAKLWKPPVREDKSHFRERQKEKVARWLQGLAKYLPSSAKSSAKTQRMMVRAGFRRPETATILKASKVVLTTGLLSLVYFTGVYESNPFFILLAAGMAGFFLPDIWVTIRIKKRQNVIRLALADALDLMVICVEAGLALDQALLRVAHELKVAHPALSEELNIVSAEIRLGKSRIEALRALGQRTDVDDIKALVAMLIQTDRFGTSVAQSLRVHSDNVRSKRRQRAEEAAAKTTVKMVPALVFFIFPALFVVILGPAVITIMRQFMQTPK
jgi:tight adherence protein C